METLEKLQGANVESILAKILREASSKSSPYSKDEALEQLLDLKVTALESKHAKASYFAAVFQAMKDKMTDPDDRFKKKYLIVLLGDKDQEKVLEKIAKVDKVAPRSQPSSAPATRGNRAQNIRCFYCRRYGHYQRVCPEKFRDSARGRPAKRGRWASAEPAIDSHEN